MLSYRDKFFIPYKAEGKATIWFAGPFTSSTDAEGEVAFRIDMPGSNVRMYDVPPRKDEPGIIVYEAVTFGQALVQLGLNKVIV